MPTPRLVAIQHQTFRFVAARVCIAVMVVNIAFETRLFPARHLRATAAVLARFQRERQLLAGLDHPGIARMYEGGETDDGLPYLVMEFVDGAPIDRWADEHRLTTHERVALSRKVCAAVHGAHQRLIVHRDLKPSNVLVGSDGEPKLLDFGIAKMLDPEDGEAGELTLGGPVNFGRGR